MNNACPCLSAKPYHQCCLPLHLGHDKADSPEQLMRSRYCAFVKNDLDYVYITHSPITRHNITLDSIKEWSQQCQWLSLDIRQVDTENDSIEFVAWYKHKGQLKFHHEVSRFHQNIIDPLLSSRLEPIKQTNAWYYLDAKYPENIIKMPNRNDLCICKSMKKFKKCCG